MRVLDEYMIKVILTLHKTSQQTISELIRNSNISPNAVYNAVKKLKDAGLIVEELEKEFPRRRLISLTEKGKFVAEKLTEIERVLDKN